MAFWVGRGPNVVVERDNFVSGGNLSLSNKRRYELFSKQDRGGAGAWDHGGREHHSHHNRHQYDHEAPKRPRLEDWAGVMDHHYQDHHHHHHSLDHQSPPAHDYARDHLPSRTHIPVEAVPVRNVAFLIIREASPVMETPPAPPISVAARSAAAATASMERTESGLSISSDTSTYDENDEDAISSKLVSDVAAARMVHHHIGRLRPDSQSERILKNLVNPKHDYLLDDNALLSLFSAANDLFFANRLTRRVAWDWSHQSSDQYAQHIVGTTALRRSAKLGGYETLIVLSSPILKDTQYNRRLLISTFIHEMIHSFLFVTCGLKARHNGGHTPGFQSIANAIDDWVGRDYLRLGDMEADLERFRGQDAVAGHSCSGQTEWQACEQGDYYLENAARRPRSPVGLHGERHWSEREDLGTTPPAYARPPANMPPMHATTIPPAAAAAPAVPYPHHYQQYHPQEKRQEHYYQHPPLHRYNPHHTFQ